jgi:predicted dehydrogenase
MSRRRAAIGVVGAGWYSTLVHLPALKANADAELVAVCDTDVRRADIAAARFGIPHALTDADVLFSSGLIEGVVVATPHTTHFPLVSRALRAGLHVLVEKPLTTDAVQAWELVELARDRGRVLTVGSTYQFTPAAAFARDVVRTSIGDLVSVHAEFSSGTLPLFATTGDGDDNADDPGAPHGTTYSDPALSGGGQGHTQLSHLLGVLMWTTGQQAVEVLAAMDDRGLRVDLVDALVFRLTGGALCVASSTGTTPPGVPARQLIRYHGTQGMVEHDLIAASATLHLPDGSARHIANPGDLTAYPRAAPSEALVRAILTGEPTAAPADHAAASVALIDAAYRAAESSRAEPVLQGITGD